MQGSWIKPIHIVLLLGLGLSQAQDSISTVETFGESHSQAKAVEQSSLWLGLRGLGGIYQGDLYKLGKGISGCGSYTLTHNTEVIFQLGWILYPVEENSAGDADKSDMNEFNTQGGWLYTLETEDLKFKLGGHLGYTLIGEKKKDFNHFFELGADIQPMVPIKDRYAVGILFQPCFVLGKESDVLFRLGLSFHYKVN